MTDYQHNAVAVLNRRRKAEQIADWCATNSYDPAVIVDHKQRQWIVRQAIPATLTPHGKKRYPRASDETWADVVTVFDRRRHEAALASAAGRPV